MEYPILQIFGVLFNYAVGYQGYIALMTNDRVHNTGA
jgi:hypothetical protein